MALDRLLDSLAAFFRPLRPTQPGLPSWLNALSTGDGFGHRWGRNGEFCVIGILAEESVKGAGR